MHTDLGIYRIKKIDWYGSQKYVIQKLQLLTWKALKNKTGIPTIYDTRKGAEVFLNYLKNEQKKKSIFPNY
jgi:hypothetical protein